MTFVNAPGIVTMGAIWSLDGERAENTFNYKVTGTIDVAKLNAMATTYATWAAANVAQFTDTALLLLVYMRDLTTQFGLTLDFTPTSTIQGTNASGLLPNNVTFALKRETGLAGRKNRGRIYWLGVNSNQRGAPQTLLSATANAWVGLLNNLMNSQASSNSAQEVIYHRALGTGTPVIGYTYTDLTLDSQRRRLPGHNRHH